MTPIIFSFVKSKSYLFWSIGLLFVLSFECAAQGLMTVKLESWTFDAEIAVFERFYPGIDTIMPRKGTRRTRPTGYTFVAPHNYDFKPNAVSEQLKREWQAQFPHAEMIEMHHYPLMESQGMNGGQSAFVWIVSKGRVFNLELVRRGGCLAQEMLLDEKDLPYLLIARYVYDGMKDKLIEAEKLAKKERLGIWSAID